MPCRRCKGCAPRRVTPDLAPNAARFEPLPAHRAEVWDGWLSDDEPMYSELIGYHVEEIRTDYARLRLPYRPQLRQPAGVVHGGAIASLIDSVVVPAIGSGYDDRPGMVTVSMLVQYLGGVVEQDAVAEGWVQRRGRSIVFCRAEVRTAGDGALVATGDLVYSIRPNPPG
jgi:uncharacterized protein (TIGR00369 family)